MKIGKLFVLCDSVNITSEVQAKPVLKAKLVQEIWMQVQMSPKHRKEDSLTLLDCDFLRLCGEMTLGVTTKQIIIPQLFTV